MLVVQADELTAAGTPLVIVLPLTTQVRPGLRQWRVGIPARDRLRKACRIIIDQARAFDRARLGEGPPRR